jgi:hypothetical protein
MDGRIVLFPIEINLNPDGRMNYKLNFFANPYYADQPPASITQI